MLIRIRGAISNCYLLKADRPVLVDAGAPGDLRRILSALRQQGVHPEQLALILLTHGHSTSAGCAAELHRISQAPIALHAGDAALVRQGRNGVLAPQSHTGRLLRPFLDEPFEAFEPDIIFHEGITLEPYGLRGQVLPTPGHTPGSVSIVLASGEALIGDILRGSLFWPNRARPHYFCNNPDLNQQSIVRLAREGLLRCHPGQHGSFPGSELGRYLDPTSGQLLEWSREQA